MQAKKLIEVAMPIKEISAESVRDKSIRHGHISTLHMWWARRPLPVCRAVVFASLVPDPNDELCPKVFKEAVEVILGRENNPGDPYKPYDDIPFTSAVDTMEDNLRNRLMMFIGKFSPKYILNEKNGKATNAKDQLSDFSLIKWDNKNNEQILNIARKLIYIAHNHKRSDLNTLIKEFDQSIENIREAENELYNFEDRFLENNNVNDLESTLKNSIEDFLNQMPKVFDPFAGGGAIPLEASRLGCRTYGNDINPVAHIIQKASLVFPQRFGKQIIISRDEFIKKYGIDYLNEYGKQINLYENHSDNSLVIKNRLTFDVEYYAKKLLSDTKNEIGYLYPKSKNGDIPIAFFWARVANCSNPTCKAEVPLLRRFALCDTPNKKVYFKPIVNGTKIDFEIINEKVDGGWFNKSMSCPCCGSTTSISDLKDQANSNLIKHRLLAIIDDSAGGKIYRIPLKEEIDISNLEWEKIDLNIVPNEMMKEIPDLVSGRGWGIKYWYQMFTNRQLYALQNLILKFNQIKLGFEKNDYNDAISTYLAIFLDRIIQRQTSFGIWDISRENVQAIFGRQSVAMMFDYPESNPFSEFGGGALNQLDWITRYIESESINPFNTILQNASSGEKEQFNSKEITAVITDPPYYDAIAYADLSDFFYVWLKRTIGDIYPLNFATPQTPKSEECTALKHNHDGDKVKAKDHFENKLLQIFDAIEHQTSDIVSIMFAHQSTEAWSTLCNSILGARMNITGSWALDTEYSFTGLKQGKSFLSSSVTVSARPVLQSGTGDYKNVKKDIEATVAKEVNKLYKLGFRGADLLTACFGQAVSVFGQFEKVEKADGSLVQVAELLEMARESAFNALLKGFVGDDFTKFYIGWLQLFSFSNNEHNTALRIVQIGLSINLNDLYRDNILIQSQSDVCLATYQERNQLNKNLGEKETSNLIDKVHKAMWLFKGTSRISLLEYISKYANTNENNFWRVLTSLCEILPNGCDDYHQAFGLLSNKESLIKESSNLNQNINQQGQLEF